MLKTELNTSTETGICSCGKIFQLNADQVKIKLAIGPKTLRPFMICPDCKHAENKKKEEESRIQKQIDQLKRLQQIRLDHRSKARNIKLKLDSVIPSLYSKAHIRSLSIRIKSIISELPFERGLYIFGDPGVGKTFLAAALGRKFITAGRNVKRVQWTWLCKEIRNTYSNGASEYNILKSLVDADLLILEDIGVDKSGNESDFAKTTLYSILDNRVENLRPFIITSNKSVAEIEECFGRRIASRIIGASEVIHLSGPDRRRENL